MLWTRGDAISTETRAPYGPEARAAEICGGRYGYNAHHLRPIPGSLSFAADRGVYHRLAPGADRAQPIILHADHDLKAKSFRQTES